jgi:DNA invertase Pin-like site-specific DNA recombinase
VAEFERGLIAERVKEGMANAKRKAAKIGRQGALEQPHLAQPLAEIQPLLPAGTLSNRAAARELKIGLATLDRVLACER